MSFSLTLKDVAQLDQNGSIRLHDNISNVITAKGLPIKTSYHLAKIGTRIVDELEQFQKARSALIKELGEEVMREEPAPTGEDPKAVKLIPTGLLQVRPENNAEFQAKHKELLDVEFSIDLKTIAVAELGDKADLPAIDLMACKKFITD